MPSCFVIERSVEAWPKSGSRRATSIENHKSVVDRKPDQSIHLAIQIEMAALPLHKSHPAPGPQIVTFPDAVGRNPSPWCSRGPLRSLSRTRRALPGSTPSRGSVGRYPDPVGRYPGPRRPGAWSVSIPIPSAAIHSHRGDLG